MRITHVNATDTAGGAAVAAWRLHAGLLQWQEESRLLVGRRHSSSARVEPVGRRSPAQMAVGAITRRIGLNYVENWQTRRLVRAPWVRDANVLHLHNLHGGYFGYPWLDRLTRARPTVWTLHDMWALTGHCSSSFDCERWKTGCGRCPYPQTYPAIERDATAIEWRWKRRVYARSSLTVVCPSDWLAGLARQSMLGRFEVEHIPHGLDTSVYQPIDPALARRALGIDERRRVVLAVADNLSAPGKGGDLLAEALAGLDDRLVRADDETVLLVTMGRGGEALAERAGVAHLSLGYVSGDRLKALAYSAADVFAFPTRADIFGLVLQESMACGTPMVSFRVGGVPELVRDGETGLLAEPEEVRGLRDGIAKLLSDEPMRRRMGERCREVAVNEYGLDLQVERMLAVYHRAVERWHQERAGG